MAGWSRRSGDDASSAVSGQQPAPPPPPDEPPASEPLAGEAMGISGDLPCTRVGCRATNAVLCAYMDRRGSVCATAWCPDDQLVVAGHAYCPRHGHVVAVLHVDGPTADPLPDVDNRAASLVEFIAEAIGPSMDATLHAVWPGDDLHLGVQPLSVQYAAPGRRRVWTRKWSLHSHTGAVVSVSLVVAEDQDHLLITSVDARPVAELVPPWIASREAASDDAVRQGFYDTVLEAIRAAVEKAHVRSREVMLRTNRP